MSIDYIVVTNKKGEKGPLMRIGPVMCPLPSMTQSAVYQWDRETVSHSSNWNGIGAPVITDVQLVYNLYIQFVSLAQLYSQLQMILGSDHIAIDIPTSI